MEHECKNTAMRTGSSIGFSVDRENKVLQNHCQACGEKWDMENGKAQFYIWAQGYGAGKSAMVNLLMDAPTPDMERWK